MPTKDRRAAARRRVWGRGPIILRFEPLEGRQLLASAKPLPDLVGQSFQAPTTLNLGQSFTVNAVIKNDGTASVPAPIQVVFYASPSPGVNSDAVAIGLASVPAGLQPGTTANLSQHVTLPATLAGLGPSGTFYVGMAIDPSHLIQEGNTQNNVGVGLGVDTAMVTLNTPPVVTLVGKSLQLSSNQTEWGGSFGVTEQIANTGNANAPATTALVVLTPAGVTPGGPSDVTVGAINVPALAAGQSTTVTQSINLPATPPPLLRSGNSTYTLSIVQDGDYLTNPLYPHRPTQGLGRDEAEIAITTPSFASSLPSSLPQLQVTGVFTPTTTISWGQNLQMNATLQNTGTAGTGPIRIRYLLVGTDGTLNGLFLGDTEINNLAAGASTGIVWTVPLPSIPPGTVNSQGVARIAVVVDPEHSLVQTSTAGNIGFSGNLTFQNPSTTTASTPSAPAPTTTTPNPSTPSQPTTPPRSSARRTNKPKPKPKPAGHSISHELKVFGSKISSEYHKLIKKL